MTQDFNYEPHILQIPGFQSAVSQASDFFNKTPICKLLPSRFNGCGVYALYYVGDFELYEALARANKNACTEPIYVGKAVPPGRRTGRTIVSRTTRMTALYARLREHEESIRHANNLRTEDFRCRLMIMFDALTDLIVPVESALIREHSPLWNKWVSGFGIHVPGKGRSGQQPSEWDTLHPGRELAEGLTGAARNMDDIIAKVKDALKPSLLS